jgi:hypothetical protein
MTTYRLCQVAALVSLASLLAPANAQVTRKRSLNINTEGNAERCSDLKVRSNGEVAQSTEAFTLQAAEAPVLELIGDNTVFRVKAWDRAEYAVETCKVAVGETMATAEQTMRAISVIRSAGRFTSSGPSRDDGSNWQLYFFVNAPRNANVNVETKNGPISIAGLSGSVKARALNGPVSVSENTGMVDVQTTNGPISFNGNGGEAHLNAKNGPISVNLSGEMWNGTRLEAHTDNGPVSLNMPETFHSGVRVETSAHSPVSCKVGACQSAWTDVNSDPRVMQMNGSQDTIRVSTHNGPVSVGTNKKLGRII